MMDLRPKLVAASQRLQEPINQCDVIADMDSVRRKVNIVLFQLQMKSYLAFLQHSKTSLMKNLREITN